ncbi:MAG TPA: tRNA-dihydrouridine synthase family protein, partial [Candidatus Thermoplasmatota archaeon]|nr:tRNA-dihydrouridine synthase family protein [Candidatus Thermoplasmatota archaeon]
RRLRELLVLSPMVDVTDAAFRSLAAAWGADVTCSEMVAASGLLRDNPTAWRHLEPWPGEAPYGVQFMCGEPAEMGGAVRHLATRLRPDFVDVNLGCPAPNILRSCAGGFLLRDPRKAGAVVRAAKAAAEEAGIPHVSAKMRLGPNAGRLTYLEVAREAQAAGASWVTLHARTVEQGYAGQADWSHIARLVEAVDIPVVGNGDLWDPAAVVRMRDGTGCAGFFVARAAMRDPTIFRRMRQALETGESGPEPTLAERLRTLREYLARAASIGIVRLPELQRQATRFVAGGAGARRLRAAFAQARTVEALRAQVEAALACASEASTGEAVAAP